MEKIYWQDRIVAYSQLQHFKFEEGRLVEALDELRRPWRSNYMINFMWIKKWSAVCWQLLLRFEIKIETCDMTCITGPWPHDHGYMGQRPFNLHHAHHACITWAACGHLFHR